MNGWMNWKFNFRKIIIWKYLSKVLFEFSQSNTILIFVLKKKMISSFNKSSKIIMKVCNTDRFQFHAWKGFDFWPLNFFSSNCCCCAELQFWTTRHVFHHIQNWREQNSWWGEDFFSLSDAKLVFELDHWSFFTKGLELQKQCWQL